MVDVCALSELIAYISLNQGAFGSRTMPTRRSLLIQLVKELADYENQQPSSSLPVSGVITKICHVALHKRNDVTPVQVRKTKKRRPCMYNAVKLSGQNILQSFAVSAEDCKPTLLCCALMLST